MNISRRVIFNLTTLTSASLGGWYLGRCFEQKQRLNEEDNGTARIQKLPGLPLFGTVSAATPFTPVEKNFEMGTKVSIATRVSEVGRGLVSTNQQLTCINNLLFGI